MIIFGLCTILNVGYVPTARQTVGVDSGNLAPTLCLSNSIFTKLADLEPKFL